MSTIGLIHKKRALFTGLQPLLRDSELNEAIYLWEQKYADTPTYSLRYYVADLQRRLNLSIAAKTLLLNIMRAFTLPEKELLPDPSARVNAYITYRRG